MSTQRVVVVTGGAVGIGAAIAEELGRSGAFVVTLDPMVAVDGSARVDAPDAEPTTAERIVAAGGTARASNASVTDADAVSALFASLVEEFGSLDAVVNIAGITRPSGFASGAEKDWLDLLSVHLDGYLNVLRAALPIMAAAGHGRILGVTSGSGWRGADAGAYSCAKRGVAALTWQLGRAAPSGVTVNALSPIAATRMVAGALARQAAAGNKSGSSAASGGVALGNVPPPENLGPVGAYLASEEFSWCSGQVIYSVGSEVAVVSAPHLLEVARTEDVDSLPHALAELVPTAFVTAEAAQASNGGGTPRFGEIFSEAPAANDGASAAARCVIVTDDAGWGGAVNDALSAQGVECVSVGDAATGFEGTAEQLATIARDSGPIDALVVAFVGDGATGTDGTAGRDAWQQILGEHTGITEHIRTDASWVRGATDYSAAAERPIRVVTVTNATTAGGRSRAQAAAQFARSAHSATSDRVDAFSISVETAASTDQRPIAEVIAHLVCSVDAAALSGAELVAGCGWFGLRSHPSPAGTITFGGPTVPDWLDDALRGVVAGASS